MTEGTAVELIDGISTEQNTEQVLPYAEFGLDDGSVAAYSENWASATESQWQGWIASNLKDFKGNIHNAAQVLANVTLGLREVLANYNQETIPDFGIDISERGKLHNKIAHKPGSDAILITQHRLEELSQLPREIEYEELRYLNPIQYARAAGWEEGDHFDYYLTHPGYEPQSSRGLSVERYLSQPHELRALYLQDELMRKNDFPHQAIEHNQQLIAGAEAYRASSNSAE